MKQKCVAILQQLILSDGCYKEVVRKAFFRVVNVKNHFCYIIACLRKTLACKEYLQSGKFKHKILAI